MVLGIALDVGTTTIAGSLVNIPAGETLKTASSPNPQARWGRDVVSRIKAVEDDPETLAVLKRSVIGACNGIITELTHGVEGSFAEVTAAGNTVMEHILLGVSPLPLARPPYRKPNTNQ